jgi:TPR repeat protein
LITKEEGYAKVYEKKYYEILEYLKEQRFVGVEHNLFLSSMLGNPGASLMMGNMLKEGLGMEKNCTSALAYYFSVIKESIVDTYEFRHGYSDEASFEKELYSKKRA